MNQVKSYFSALKSFDLGVKIAVFHRGSMDDRVNLGTKFLSTFVYMFILNRYTTR